METAQWFYARDGQQHGPIALDQARQLAAQGAIRPTDLAWCEGMPQWKPAGEIPALSAGAAAGPQFAQAASMSVGPVSPVGYYTAAMGMPARAVENLKGHATQTGDTAIWPLDDGQVAQFQEAVKLRKKVTGAASLYRLFLLLSTITAAVLVITAIGMSLSNGRNATSATFGLIVGAGTVVAFTVLYYFAWRGTMRSQRWAPLTMFIIYVLATVFYLFAAIVGASSPESGALAGGLLGFIFAAIFGVVSWRSFAAIPKFLSQPAWCQELIVKAGL
jgi:hypothetical protein